MFGLISSMRPVKIVRATGASDRHRIVRFGTRFPKTSDDELNELYLPSVFFTTTSNTPASARPVNWIGKSRPERHVHEMQSDEMSSKEPAKVPSLSQSTS